MEPIQQEHYPDKGVLLFSVRADFNNENAIKLSAKTETALETNWMKLVVDISKAKYISSTGLGQLLKIFDMVGEKEGKLVLIPSGDPQVRLVLQTLGFNDLMLMADSLDEAFELLE